MELRHYLTIVRQRVWLVLLGVVAGLIGGYLVTPSTSSYRATTVIYIGAREFSVLPQSGDLSNDRVSATERLVATFARMLRSEPIAADAINRTGVSRSAGAVVGATTATGILGTQLLEIDVTDRDPTIAAALANGIAESFVTKVQTFEPGTPAGVGTLPSLPAYVFDRAAVPTAPESTGLTRNLILNGLFGLLAAIGFIVLLEYLDVTIRSPDDVERRLDLPVLGNIAIDRDMINAVLAAPGDERAVVAEHA